MKRDYKLMKRILGMAARAERPVEMTAFGLGERERIASELRRLGRDGLVESDMTFDAFGEYEGGKLRGLTDEGREFHSLIANGDAWAIMLGTLEKADIDIPYPLLKEVCEEVVKRYVTSFIPEIPRRDA